MEGMCSGSGDCEVFNYPQSRSTERSTELTPKVSVAALIFALHGCPLSFKGDERSGGVSFFSEGATSSRALTWVDSTNCTFFNRTVQNNHYLCHVNKYKKG